MLKVVFTLEAAVDFAYGVGLIAVPGPLLALYDMRTDEAGTYLGHFLAGTFIGFGLINWFARSWPDSTARRLIIRANFATTALGLLATLAYVLQAGTSPRVWAIVILTAAFTLAWGWFAADTLRAGPPGD